MHADWRGPRPRAGILDIAPYRAGPADAWPTEAGARLSLNEQATGPSPRAQAAYAAAAARLGRYGDSEATALKTALGARFGYERERLVCGNGSEELLLAIAQGFIGPGDTSVFSAYSFLVYAIATQAAGGVPVVAPARGLAVDVDAMLAAVTARTRVLFLANPNNPTGLLLPNAEVRRLHAGLPPDVLLVLDSAYAEFVGDADYSAGADLVRAHSNVLMLRTFSKAYGLAGARVGYAYAAPEVVAVLDRIRPPFNLSTAAEAAAVAALDDTEHLAASVAAAAAGRVQLGEGLRRLGWQPAESATNFVTARAASPEAAAAAVKALAEHGILVRPLRGYGLPEWIRFTVGTPAVNRTLLDVLAERV